MAFARLSLVATVAFALSNLASAALIKRVTCSTGHVTANAACCVLFPIVDDLQKNLFDGAECGEEAHSALRMAFHDAIGFSLKGGLGGGADGSILAFNETETAFHANGGIDDIVASQFPHFVQSKLSAGDFVHLAAAVGTANCAGAPRLKFLLGRPPPKAAAPDHTVPEPTDSVTAILARFADAGFSPREVVALLASHTIAAADVIDPSIPGTPFDSSPTFFDGNFFLEVLLRGRLFPGAGQKTGEVLSPLAGEMRLQSDFAISQDSRTACFWQDMINDQTRIMTEFGAAMAKLQVLGQNTKTLIDCSDVIPTPVVIKGTVRIPATFVSADIQIACPAQAFPKLATRGGPAPTIAPVPPS